MRFGLAFSQPSGEDAMSTHHRTAAARLATHLRPSSPPVGIAMLDDAPPSVPPLDRALPSACAMWRLAEQRVFFAPAAAHLGCPIGAMVMGFSLGDDAARDLRELVGHMLGLRYITDQEIARIPRIGSASGGAVYGPLAELPVEPDLALVWLLPSQAMLLAEALGATSWTAAPTPALGRPACAALPMALKRHGSTISLGCTGMRTFTEIAPDRLLAVLARPALALVDEALERTLAVNEEMRGLYEARRDAATERD
jgi:uncharacterized protein (DUF169 family)